MNLKFDLSLAEGYKSRTQQSRRLTEGWVGDNLFCPRCGYGRIEHFDNNRPVADFCCPKCGGQYELKSKRGGIGGRICGGAYETMIERITSSSNPDFLFLSYSPSEMRVTNLIVVPKHFFVPSIIEKRKPLAPSARRHGWVGCNILLSYVPEQGRIAIIQNGAEIPAEQVIAKLNRSTALAKKDLSSRGWLFDVLNCVNTISGDMFTLADMYGFEEILSKAHPDNHNIKAKIRQQLQILRDAGYLEFLERGKYRRLY
ncbi:MAG: DpnI domain-containing protein [Synergistaceae bacterium]